MKLAYLIARYPAINHGYLLSEIRHLRQLGFEVEVASISAPDRGPAQLSAAEREEAARTRYIKNTPPGRILLDHAAVAFSRPLRYFRTLCFAVGMGRGWRGRLYQVAYFIEAVLVGRWMQAKRLDRLHASFCTQVALLVSRLFDVRMSFAVYGYGELHDPAATHLAEKIRAACLVRAISLHSRSLLMLESGPDHWDKILALPLGVDVEDYVPRPVPAGPFQLVSVGRLATEKGQRLLLDAVALLAAQGRQVRLCLVGDGPDRRLLEEQARAQGIAGLVDFKGWVDQAELSAAYASARAFVLASLYEGIPIVLMEAMAMEIPCVAPCITGIPELISHREEGLLFAPASVPQLAACLAELHDDEALCRRLGAAARRRVLRDYDLAANTRRLAEALESRG